MIDKIQGTLYDKCAEKTQSENQVHNSASLIIHWKRANGIRLKSALLSVKAPQTITPAAVGVMIDILQALAPSAGSQKHRQMTSAKCST